MKDIFKKYLFTKNILVADKEPKDQFETAVSLSKIYAVKVLKGMDLLNPEHMTICEEMIGSKIKVPKPFYKGFPESVKSLTPDQILFDQLYSYFHIFWLGDRLTRHHSIFEGDFEEAFDRLTFTEDFEYKHFEVLSEKDAFDKLTELCEDLFASTRPLSEEQMNLVNEFMLTYNATPTSIASKDTALELIFRQRNMRLVQFIDLADVIKLVEKINYYMYGNYRINKLNLRNQDRKLIKRVLHEILAGDRYAVRTCANDRFEKDIAECCEKKKAWKGLLHHIHFKPVNDDEVYFIKCMRYGINVSAYSMVEYFMRRQKPVQAAEHLCDAKGSGAVIRSLEYFISRCETTTQKESVLRLIHSGTNGILLIQLYLHYCCYDPDKIGPRNFVFTKFNMTRVHKETAEEVKRRKTKLSKEDADLIRDRIGMLLADHYGNKIPGKVYISPEMRNVALPLQETSSSFGIGTLPTGSRTFIPKDKVLRVFIYWEKVDILDLSATSIDADGNKIRDYNWTNIEQWQRPYMVHSGDCCDGYYGGSEYIDLDVDGYRNDHPKDRYLIFNVNAWSGLTFDKFDCHAGYMIRDKVHQSGAIFEPVTVKTSYTIDGNSKFAYLFAVDLWTNELVWLNIVKDSKQILAAASEFDFLVPYICRAKELNVFDFFNIAAEKIVRHQNEADIIVSNDIELGVDVSKKEVVRPYDFEKMFKYMNL